MAAEAEKREKEKKEKEKEQQKAAQKQQEQLRQDLDQQTRLENQLPLQSSENECSNQSYPEISAPTRDMSDPTPPPPPSLPDYSNSGCLSSNAPPTPSTATIPVSPATPITPMAPAPVTPTTPTFPVKFPCSPTIAIPAPRVASTPASDASPEKGGRGRKTGGKAAKSKEEKEREKELRKERLRVQQEKERQWKLLQQKRQLENQRQTQQHQQENILMRQELRRTQQTKAKPFSEENKKKVSVKKAGRRPSLPSNQQGGTFVETNDANRDNSTPEGTVLTVLQEGDTRMQGNSGIPRPDGNTRNHHAFEQQVGEQSLNSSRDIGNQPLENNDRRSLSRPDLQMEQLMDLHPPPNPMSSGTLGLGEDHSTEQQQQNTSWTGWPEKLQDQNPHTSSAVWTQQQQSSFTQQPNQGNDQVAPSQLVNDPQPEVIHPTSWQQKPQEQSQPWLESTQQRDESFRPDTSKPQQVYTTQEHFQQQPQAWQQRQFELGQQQQPGNTSNVTPDTPHDLFRHQNQGCPQEGHGIPEQSALVDNRVSFQPRQHNIDMELQQDQRVDETNLQQGQPLSHWQHDPTSVPSQARGQSIPQPQHQGQLQGFQHSNGQAPQAHSSGMNSVWPNAAQEEALSQMQPPIPVPQSNQPQPLSHQHLPHSQAQHPVISVPQQPMQQIPAGMMRPPSNPPHSAPQAPPPPPPPPPPPVVPSQPAQVPLQQPVIPPLQNLPHDDPQQIELIQQQHREQLLRMQQQQQQQQQFYQLQVQQQHQLLQQQQGGNTSVQGTILPVSAPPVHTASHQTAQFARQRAPQFVSPKDMPEIDSEEEHQERLRFLYKQRQAQKHQQLQSQLLQQQLAQGMVPGVVDPSNPQTMQQLAQIRPQFPELMQQQMMLEYQRRMAQRQGLGQQTLQYDKVLQEFQQRQGGHLGPQQGPMLDLSHQRFAIRPPATGLPPGLQQGQVALYGLDPTKQQQLYQMQLQQQQLLLQQQQQQRKPSSDQQTVSQPSKAAPKTVESNSDKDITVATETVAKSDRSMTPTDAKCDTSNDTALKVKKEKAEKATKELEETDTNVVHLPQIKEDSRGEMSNVKANSDEKTGLHKATCQESDCCHETKQVNEEDTSTQKVEESLPPTAVKEKPILDKESEEKSEPNTEKENVTTAGPTKPEQCTDNPEKCGDERTEVEESANTSQADKISDTGISDEKLLKEQGKMKTSETKDKEYENVSANRLKDVDLTASVSKIKDEQERNMDQPQNAPLSQLRCSQPQSGKSVSQVMLPNSQAQQQVAQQQLMGLGHQFSVMQQQQAVYMQQYQALQQQFQQSQGQNAVVGQSLISLQRQAQMLQQQMIQVRCVDKKVKANGYFCLVR